MGNMPHNFFIVMENLEIFLGRLMVVAFIKFGLDELLAV